MTTIEIPQWISLYDALHIEGSPNTDRLGKWILDWNRRTDTVNKIRRRPRKVELRSLIAALEEEEKNFTDKRASSRQALTEASRQRQFPRPVILTKRGEA